MEAQFLARAARWREQKQAWRKAAEAGGSEVQAKGADYLASLREIHGVQGELFESVAKELQQPARLACRHVRSQQAAPSGRLKQRRVQLGVDGSSARRHFPGREKG